MHPKETLKSLNDKLNVKNESPYPSSSMSNIMAFQIEKEPVIPMPNYGQLRPYNFPQETSPY